MLMLQISVVISTLFVLVLKGAASLVVESAVPSREELSCYECGFECNNLSRIPFSLRYFYLTLVFLLFDLEVSFMLFIVYFTMSSFLMSAMLLLLGFLTILLCGLIYEWVDGSLDWLN